MKSLKEQLTEIVAQAFVACGFDASYGEVIVSNRPDLGQFQCSGALTAAKRYNSTPRQIAQQVVDQLASQVGDKLPLERITIADPGFLNLHIYAAMRGESLEQFQQTRNAPGA